MAVTSNTYTGNGSTTQYSITFQYIATTDIKAQINGVATTAFSLANATTLQFNSAPANGAAIVIYRETDDTNIPATFFAGSSIRSQDLNDNFTQTLFIGQETSDRALSTLGGTMSGDVALGQNAKLIFEGSTANDNETTLTVTNPTADRTITLPNVTGTVVTTGDTGSVSNTMLADAELKELATMSSGTASALADLSQTEVQKIDGLTASTAELNKLDGVTASTAELNLTDGLTSTTAELNHVSGVTSSIQTQINAKQPLDAELTELATMPSATAAALADLTQAEVQSIDGITATTAELNILDGVTATTDEINILSGVTATAAELNMMDGCTATVAELNILDGVTATAAEINTLDGVPNTLTATELGYVDGVTSSIQTQINSKQPLDSELTTLSGMQAGTASVLASGTALTASTAELNQLDGKTITGSFSGSGSNDIPTSSAINSHFISLLDSLGGFVAISNEVSFPNANPDPSDNAGTVVSIQDAGGVVINGSGVSTTGRTVGGSTVTINGFPSSLYSKTLAAGLGLQVQTTSTLNTYTYHKLIAKEADVEQLSTDINDFAARYRVGGSNPTTDLDNGDLFFNTGTGKMLVYNSNNTAWEEVQSVGNFFINTISSYSGTGGNSATFNGTAWRFTLSNAPTNAEQLLVSINGVVQKPTAGTSQPAEGFSIDGSSILFSSAPPSGSDWFIITIGSAVNVGTPSNNTVSTAIIQNGAVTGEKIATNLDLADNKKIRFGTGNDLELFHDASHSWINNTTGNLYIKGSDVRILGTNNDNMIKAVHDGAVELYYDGVKKFETTANGITVGTHVWTTGGNYTVGNAVLFPDSAEARFGTGDDLKIYHNNSHSLIQNSTGNLYIQGAGGHDGNIVIQATYGEESILAKDNGAVELYYDNSKKLETFADGIKVYEDIDLSGSTPQIKFHDTTNTGYYHTINTDNNELRIFSSSGGFGVYTGTDDSGWNNTTRRLHISNDGQLRIPDSGKFTAGDSQDLQIYHNGTNSYLNNSTGFMWFGADNLLLTNAANSEYTAKFTANGSVELYHNNFKSFQTNSAGINLYGPEAGDCVIDMSCDEGDDNADKWRINAGQGGSWQLKNYAPGSWDNFIVATVNAGIELYHDNVKKLSTDSDGVRIDGAGGSVETANSTLKVIHSDSGVATNDKTLLLLQNGTDGGDLGSQDSYIDFIFRDSNNNRTPQTRIASHVGDGGDANSVAKEGRGFLTFHCSNTDQEDNNEINPPERFRIAANGDLTATDTSISSNSDSRLKKDVTDYSYPLSTFKQFKPKTFNWINPQEHSDKNQRGFIAQEVKAIDPYLTSTTLVLTNSSDLSLVDSDGTAHTTKLGETDAMYVSVINQLITKIETLETKVAALEAK